MRIPSLCLAAVSLFLGAVFGNAHAATSSGRLYVTNSLGDDITVIDLQTLKVIENIKVGEQVHGVCAPADGHRLFTTIESERNLKIIDTKTGKILAVIPLTGLPNECAATPDGRYVGIPIRDGNSVDIVDTTKQKVVKVLPVKVPHNCYNSGNNDDLYVSSMGSDEIDRIDLRTMSYSEKIPVGVFRVPMPYPPMRRPCMWRSAIFMVMPSPASPNARSFNVSTSLGPLSPSVRLNHTRPRMVWASRPMAQRSGSQAWRTTASTSTTRAPTSSWEKF